jgi:hypothetical protein
MLAHRISAMGRIDNLGRQSHPVSSAALCPIEHGTGSVEIL